MKNAYLSVLIALGLALPASALAQATDPQQPEDTAPSDAPATSEGDTPPATADGAPGASQPADGAVVAPPVEPVAVDPAAAEPPVAEPPAAEPVAAEPPAAEPVAAEPVAAEADVSVQAEGAVGLDLAAATDDMDAADEDDAVDDEGPKLPWRNSLFTFDQSLNAYAFSESSQLTYNPTYVWAFGLRPRWYLSDDVFLRLRQDLDVELTDADARAQNQELWLYDTQIDINHSKLAEFFDTTASAGARVYLPLSQTSQARNRVFGGAAYGSLDRPLKEIYEDLSVTAGLTLLHWFATSNITSVDDPYPCHVLDSGSNSQRVCGQTGGASNIANEIRFSLAATVEPIERLSASIGMLWWWQDAYSLADATVGVDSAPGGTVTLADASDTHWRNNTWFTVDVGYDFTDWINGSLGLGTLTGQLDPDGTGRNPFFNVDTQLSLTATVTLDALYTELQADEVASAENDSANGAAHAQAEEHGHATY